MVVNVLGDAADAVAAHLGLGTVGVEHAHLRIRNVGRADQNQTVRADAEVTITDPDSQFGRIYNCLAEAVDVHIVIAQPVHFGKFHKILTDSYSCPPILYA
jgi:hypothetical protein